MTPVTIDGADFDPFNAQVSFNGTPGRVVSATSTQLVTNVPYGSTTGPVSVSSHGHSVIGPVFVVTAPAASANLASTTYSFTDASPGAGGTNLVFSGNDDSTVAVTLPFTFSLFRDIYTAGSLIAVATNGFISRGSRIEPQPARDVGAGAGTVRRGQGNTEARRTRSRAEEELRMRA
jgi:hypothetical protein